MFADASGDRLPIPVVPTLGNNDILPHNILLPGPNKWLQYYTDVWRRFIPEEQRHSFEFGGWFYVEVIPNKLAVFSLNTLYFFDRNAGVDDCASPSEPGYKQMEWLRVQLQFMRERGMKAIMMGHVPPARTDSKKLWAETCWQKYTLWLQQYRDVVTGSVYGHMNIDHFLIQDTKDIDLSQLSGPSANRIDGREPMGDELSIESATDYLQELRDDWSKLARPAAFAGKPGEVDEDKNNKRKKGKKPKKKDPWGERYQLSFVSPSIVPTYFPTLRVYEYNISGLEQTALWADAKAEINLPAQRYGNDQKHLDLRDLSDPYFEVDSRRKKPKNKHPKPPNFVMPEPPAKTSPPGPAYSPQPLTLTGYVQYFANLTEINNLTLDDSIEGEAEAEEPISWIDWILRWHKGKHGGKKPRSPHPQPREFKFQVEYTTRDDKIYKLTDLTVNSFVDLAYRIGQRVKGNAFEVAEVESDSDDEGVVGDLVREDEDLDSDSDDDELEIDKKKGKKEKDKKKKKKSKKQNRTWLHFLDHAFVGTVEKRDLKKIS
ncbi:hypothetical protein B0T22DRAFT_453914 [Podospora appendiculata]|uniref:Endopolyphosphatase n=1 Tax=Podospora appendiculata TaxID=314037 RepID=A0AAE0XL30_9PEZI|nr:hypothetical protein B0T22DRAFT_453914 [Podospora appendiculata]